MNKQILKLALDSGLLNYIDNETPRRYVIDGNAGINEVEEFAKMIVRACVKQNLKTAQAMQDNGLSDHCSPHQYNFEIVELFGLSNTP